MSRRLSRMAIACCLILTCLGLGEQSKASAGPPFKDTPGNPAWDAVNHLAVLGIVKGCDPPTYDYYCPEDPTLRHQMAALIVRAMPGWSDETWGNAFTDPTEDTELWRRVGTLAHHNVVIGYQPEVCQAKGKQSPCYGPLDNVTYGQAILFIARAMVAQGYWWLQSDDRARYPEQNGPVGANPDTDQQTLDHRMLITFQANAGGPRDLVSDNTAPFQIRDWRTQSLKGWGDPATRGWFARVLWQALTGSPWHGPSSSPLPSRSPSPSPSAQPNCSSAYPTVCIPPPPPDLNCEDIIWRNFTVLPPDPHNFDSDNDGIGCEDN